ncbi:UNVERIFIED_CONTAM: hypothetical protein GTU68_037516 [Idotea baltica]|nr:hypothetical protein [Idotea baltica]
MKKIQIGDKLPSFKLLNQKGKWINISDFIGRPLIIYFYPKDDTPGCTKEACTFRDEYSSFVDFGASVFGVSADSVESHHAFSVKYQLPFDLLSDEGNKLRKVFGVPSDLFGMIPGRVTYVVDSRGFVKYIFNNQLNATKHIEEALKALGSF